MSFLFYNLATISKGVFLGDALLEVVVELIAGSKAIDNLNPGPTPNVLAELKEDVKQKARLIDDGVKEKSSR